MSDEVVMMEVEGGEVVQTQATVHATAGDAAVAADIAGAGDSSGVLDTTWLSSLSVAGVKHSISLRYPAALPAVTEIGCYLCMDAGCVKQLAVYDRLECKGPACKVLAGGGAVTWFCEACALNVDLRKAFGKLQGKEFGRNLVCQCPPDSEVDVTTYAVTNGGKHNAQRCFLMSRKDQHAIEIDDDLFFKHKPTHTQLMADPGLLKVHALASLKKEATGEYKSGLTFNADKCTEHWSQGTAGGALAHKKVSIQLLYDDYAQCVRLVATTPSTTVQVKRNGSTVATKGAGNKTRGVTRGAKRQKAGTSSDSASRVDSDKNGEGVLSYSIPMKKAAANEGDEIELVCDGVLRPGGIKGLMKKLEDEDKLDTVPTFCPIVELNSIDTNIDPHGWKAADVERNREFLVICKEHACRVETNEGHPTGPRCAITKIDTGKERVFKGICKSLEICGFGDRADHWDWHVVVLRRGRRSFVTLYILAVHAPFPGVWVIVQREHIGDRIEDCQEEFMMIGEDMSPFSTYNNGIFTITRGLWKLDKMHMYMGFTAASSALEKCLNLDPDRFGLLLTALLKRGYLFVADIEASFLRQKKEITARYAQEDLACNNAYMKRIQEEQQAIEMRAHVAPSTTTAPLPLGVVAAAAAAAVQVVVPNGYGQSLAAVAVQHDMAAGTGVAMTTSPWGQTLDLGVYGMIRIVITQYATEHDAGYDEDGDVVQNVVICRSTKGVCVNATVDPDVFVKIKLYHNIGAHHAPYEKDRQFCAVYICETGDEEPAEAQEWKPGYWEYETPYPLKLQEGGGCDAWTFRDCEGDIHKEIFTIGLRLASYT